MTIGEVKVMRTKPRINWKDTKLISVLILIVTIILTFLIYGDTYHLSEEQNKLAVAISDYIPYQVVKAEVKLVHKEDDWMYIIFSDSRYGDSFMGLAILNRGWNGRYVIRSVQYGSGPVVSMDMKPDNKKQVMIYGLIQDGRAVRYEYAKSVQDIFYEVMYKGNIDEEAFFHVQENKGNWIAHFRLFDAEGKDITDSYLDLQRKDTPRGSTVTSELFMVDVQCIFILVIGLGLAVRGNIIKHNKHNKTGI